MTFFDSASDPAATGGAFPGSQVGPSLAGISTILSAVPIEIGRKQVAGGAAPAGERSVTLGTFDEPDLVSMDKAILHLFQTDDAERSVLQKKMWDGGWFSSTTYKDGYTAGVAQAGDDNDRAWNSVVMTSAKSGKSIADVLQDAIDKTTAAGGVDALTKKAAGKGEQPTAKVDLYHFANEIARNLVGREMTQAEVSKFVSQYQGQEASGAAGSPSASAEAFLQNEAGGEVGAQRMVGAFDQLMQMVGKVDNVKLGGS